MSDLHLFEIGPDTVVARDADDAWSTWCEHTGERREDYAGEEDAEPVDDAKAITIGRETAVPQFKCPHGCGTWAVADGRYPVDQTGHHRTCPETHETKTAAEWAASNGRGFLCSTEW